jgi:hypothetical protein
MITRSPDGSRNGLRLALGLSVHTGWAAAVLVGGSLRRPHVELREEIELIGSDDRFAFHLAATLPIREAQRSVERARKRATTAARRELARLIQDRDVVGCAVVANDAPMPGSLEIILAAHPRIHTAEGCLYRDALEDAARRLKLRTAVVPPRSLDPQSSALANPRFGRPWGKDQRLAAAAAWQLLA